MFDIPDFLLIGLRFGTFTEIWTHFTLLYGLGRASVG